MKTELLHQLTGRQGPFASVSFDASRTDSEAGRQIELRVARRLLHLADQGADSALLDPIREIAANPTHRSGPAGRLIVADSSGVVLDVALPEPPPRDESTYGPAPHVLPLFRALRGRIGYLLVEVDRTGADLELIDTLGRAAHRETVRGSHDVVHKVPGGAMSNRRIQARAEDSWDRNAAEVAQELDALVRQYRPDLVLIDGEESVIRPLVDALTIDPKVPVVKLSTGGRAPGVSDRAREEAVSQALADAERTTRAAHLDRFARSEALQTNAVQGLGAVVDAVRRGQVEELLLHDDPTSTLTLWVGDQPGELATSRSELLDMGARWPRQIRADTALIWAVVCTDGGVTLLDEDDRKLTEGVAAVLRWSDRSTPHDALPSMPGHGAAR